MLSDPHAHVSDALGRLERALGTGDLAAALDCFVPDGALFGAGPSEHAHGREELAAALAAMIDRGLCPEWELDDTYARLGDDGISFVADATVVVGVLGRRTRRRRFRMAGSLRGSGGRYDFELFNGLDPVLGTGLHPVD